MSAHFIFLAFKIYITVHAVLTEVKHVTFAVGLVQMNATELEECVLKKKNFGMNTSSARAASKIQSDHIIFSQLMKHSVTLCSSFHPVCCIFCSCVKLAVVH